MILLCAINEIWDDLESQDLRRKSNNSSKILSVVTSRPLSMITVKKLSISWKTPKNKLIKSQILQNTFWFDIKVFKYFLWQIKSFPNLFLNAKKAGRINSEHIIIKSYGSASHFEMGIIAKFYRFNRKFLGPHRKWWAIHGQNIIKNPQISRYRQWIWIIQRNE